MVFRTGVALIRADVVRATLARLFSGGAIKGKASAALGSNVERFCDRPDIIARNVAKLAHAPKHEQLSATAFQSQNAYLNAQNSLCS